MKLDRDQAEQKRELEIKRAESLKKKKEEKTETEKVYRKEKGSETLNVTVKSIDKEKKVRKVQSEVETNSNMLRIAEMFGGTLKQKVEREKIEKQEKVELDRQRKGKVRTRVRELETDRAEQSLDRKKVSVIEKRKCDSEKQRKDKKIEGDRETERVSISTKLKSRENKETELKGEIKMGNLNSKYRPANVYQAWVVKNSLLEGKSVGEKTRNLLQLTPEPSRLPRHFGKEK